MTFSAFFWLQNKISKKKSFPVLRQKSLTFCRKEAAIVFLSTRWITLFKHLLSKGRVTRMHISEILYSQIDSNCFLAAAQSKHRVKNLCLYNLMAAKMIEQLEIGYMSFCTSCTVVMELDTKKKSRRKIWTQKWWLKPKRSL